MVSLLHAWGSSPLRIVDTSTMHKTHHSAIEFRLYATNASNDFSLVASWYPTNIRAARAFLKAFKGEDSWIPFDSLDEFLALEGLEGYAEEIRMIFTQQLQLTPDQPLGRHVADSRRARIADRVWFIICALGITSLIAWPLVSWLTSN